VPVNETLTNSTYSKNCPSTDSKLQFYKLLTKFSSKSNMLKSMVNCSPPTGTQSVQQLQKWEIY
jgi:hypothetical protein